VAKKPAKSERQKIIDDIRKKQAGSEKRRGFLIVGVCVVIAVALVGIAAYPRISDAFYDSRYSGKPLEDIGAAASVCEKPVTKKADGNQEHVPTGSKIDYTDAPPAFGPHYNEAGVAPVPINDRFYSEDDRPALGDLVHNSEHGYTLLWYDTTINDDKDAMAQIQAIAGYFNDNDTNYRLKFKAVPWTADDEKNIGEFPDGQHIAYTHWTASGGASGTEQLGVWQYCSAPSGEALDAFMTKYPYTDAPEPYGA
jgi:hypothetical protein